MAINPVTKARNRSFLATPVRTQAPKEKSVVKSKVVNLRPTQEKKPTRANAAMHAVVVSEEDDGELHRDLTAVLRAARLRS